MKKFVICSFRLLIIKWGPVSASLGETEVPKFVLNPPKMIGWCKNMLHKIKQIIPKPWLQSYHWSLAKISAFAYGYPSNKLIVIGVTGTNGKSSTVQFIEQMLVATGAKVGYTTTAGFKIAGEAIENKMKMTMPGRFYLQSLMHKMVKTGCDYAIIETSSQGIDQFRHLGINYDVVVFTNLTPEHIEAHGGFENYKKAKGKLFKHLIDSPKKTINMKVIYKISALHADDEYSDYFAKFRADRTIWYQFNEDEAGDGEDFGQDRLSANIVKHSQTGVTMAVNGLEFKVRLSANFQIKNIVAAMGALVAVGLPLRDIVASAEKVEPLPGRFEIVDLGQDFMVIVDYAYEPYAISALLKSVKALKPKRIIGVHGSAGGGRDVARRAPIGRLAGEQEDIVIVTNEDPYDDDPRKIIEQVAKGAVSAGKKEGVDLFLIDNRNAGIEKAIMLAEKGDIVILTGKGNEPVMAVAHGKKIPWSDKASAISAMKKKLTL